MLEYPIILSKSYVNGDDTFTISSGATGQANLYDWDRDTTWQSIGSDDLTTETIEIEFYEGADAIDRDFDRFILLDTNIKEFFLQYWDGAAWQTIAETNVNDNSDVNRMFTFTKITNCSKIKLSMVKTMVVDDDKHIAEFIIGEFEFQLSNVLLSRDRIDEVKEASLRIGDGSMRYVRDYEKYAQDFTIITTSKTIRNNLKEIYDNRLAFIFVWAYDDMTDEEGGVYYVNWVGGWARKQNYRGASISYEIKMRLREV